jgi:hypothetical protein
MRFGMTLVILNLMVVSLPRRPTEPSVLLLRLLLLLLPENMLYPKGWVVLDTVPLSQRD